MTPFERQLDRIERSLLHAAGVSEVENPAERVKAIAAAVGGFNEGLHPRGKDGKFINKGGFAKGVFNWVPAGGNPNPMAKGTSKSVDRVKIEGFSSGSGGSASDPWVQVSYQGPDPELKGKVGFARASEIEESAAIKARIDAAPDPTPDNDVPADADALRDRVHGPEVVDGGSDVDADELRDRVHGQSNEAVAPESEVEVEPMDDSEMVEITPGTAPISDTAPEDAPELGESDPEEAPDSVMPEDSIADTPEAEAPVESVDDFMDKWADKGIDSFVAENEDRILLSKVVAERQGEGSGTAFMNELVEYAERQGKRIELTPSSDFGGSKSRLLEFYKRFGFVENKGRNKDYEISESMYRPPSGG